MIMFALPEFPRNCPDDKGQSDITSLRASVLTIVVKIITSDDTHPTAITFALLCASWMISRRLQKL